MGDRLATAAATEQLADRRQLVLAQRPVVLQVEVESAQPEAVGGEQLGVEAGALDAPVGEVAGAQPDDVEDGGDAQDASCAASRRRCCSSASRGSTTVSRSPSSTLGSWCTVSLMRWSVTRDSGKL